MVASVGVVLALVAAVGLAGQALCIRLGTRDGRSNDALVVVLVVNVAVIVPLAMLVHYPAYGLTAVSLAAFAAAGLSGTMLGRALFYAGIQRIGASRAEPMKASMPLYASFLAVLLLGEAVTPGLVGGTLLIVGGVALISWVSAGDAAPDAVDPPAAHLALPLLAAFFYGVEPILAKIGFAQETPVLVGLAVKTLAALTAFVTYLRLRGQLPGRADFRTGALRWYVGAGVATTVFLFGYYGALHVAPVVQVIPIVQLSPLVVVAVSGLFLQHIERVTPRLAVGAVLVVAGAVAVTVFG